MINIGALLNRLGINITTRLIEPTNISNTNIELPSTSINNHEQASTGQHFFRELGKKGLQLIALYIEKMKDKRQKYS